MDMNFRIANSKDAEVIAALHALSWQSAYANVLSEDFLENEVQTERLKYWQEKLLLAENNPAYYILLAENNQQLQGFICVIGQEDPNYGSLIDNLHVHPAGKGQGLGRELLQRGLQWAREQHPKRGVYLWVYKANHAAIRFYEKMGGLCAELTTTANPDGGKADVWRVIWSRPQRSIVERLRSAFS